MLCHAGSYSSYVHRHKIKPVNVPAWVGGALTEPHPLGWGSIASEGCWGRENKICQGVWFLAVHAPVDGVTSISTRVLLILESVNYKDNSTERDGSRAHRKSWRRGMGKAYDQLHTSMPFSKGKKKSVSFIWKVNDESWFLSIINM